MPPRLKLLGLAEFVLVLQRQVPGVSWKLAIA